MKHEEKWAMSLLFAREIEGKIYSGGFEGECVCGFKVETFGQYGDRKHSDDGRAQLAAHYRAKNAEDVELGVALAEARTVIERLSGALENVVRTLDYQSEVQKTLATARKFLAEH